MTSKAPGKNEATDDMKSFLTGIACAGGLVAGVHPACGGDAPLRLENPRITVEIDRQSGARAGHPSALRSPRGGLGDKDKIWLRSRDKHDRWRKLSLFSEVPELAEKYLPAGWQEASEAARRTGHGGGDYFELVDFIKAVQGRCPPTIGIHEAMDMTLPELISQQSIAEGGRWIEVPDSRMILHVPRRKN